MLVGIESRDDGGVYLVAPGVALVQTVDFFTPIVDDPHDWGAIAAANALSDVYAMGGAPRTAMNLVAWPRRLDFEILGAVVEGAGAKCDEAGVTIVGGHSIDDEEPKFGLAVTGTVDPDRIITKTGARPGDDLVLTKPLGMGIISSGIKEGVTSRETIARASEIMAALNREASEAMVEAGASAATDVTGFGLMGHLYQMLSSEVSATIRFEAVPVLEEAVALARKGVFPGGSRRNLDALGSRVVAPDLDDAERKVLFDAQTSGGLLIAIEPSRTGALVDEMARRGAEPPAVIGSFSEGERQIEVVRG